MSVANARNLPSFGQRLAKPPLPSAQTSYVHASLVLKVLIYVGKVRQVATGGDGAEDKGREGGSRIIKEKGTFQGDSASRDSRTWVGF